MAQLIKVAQAKVGLSTSSVYPETTSSGFELARRLGYDGVEVMVGIDPVAADIDAVEKLRDYHQVPVLAIHSPCLLITQRVWGTDPWAKLERSAEAATRLDADVVVVHPPFRWQRDYARGFVDGGAPAGRGDRHLVLRREHVSRGGRRAASSRRTCPAGIRPSSTTPNLTLDFSHASTANQQSLDLARSWGTRLRHIHLTDGSGSIKDEHLVPGRGDQQAGKVLQYLAETDFTGHVVLEVNSRKSGTRAQREADLAESLAFARLHLAAPVQALVRGRRRRGRQRGLTPVGSTPMSRALPSLTPDPPAQSQLTYGATRA